MSDNKVLELQLGNIAAVAVRDLGWLKVRGLRLVGPVLRGTGWQQDLGTGVPNHALTGDFSTDSTDGIWRNLVIPFAEITAYEIRPAVS